MEKNNKIVSFFDILFVILCFVMIILIFFAVFIGRLFIDRPTSCKSIKFLYEDVINDLVFFLPDIEE